MKRGRKPKPTALKQFTGNPGKRPISPAEIKPAVGIPDCPDWLGDLGRAKWYERISVLKGIAGLLTVVDGDALALYCEAWQELHDAKAEIKLNGSLTCCSEKGGEYVHPAVGIKNRAIARLKQFGAMFGMSPSDRVGLNLGGEVPDDDEFTAMMKSRGGLN